MRATPDSTLANPERRIADLERQLAECRAERDEALARETATAEVLHVINSSPGDLAPVFDATLAKALGLCEAIGGTFWVFDGEHIRAAAIRGMPEAFVEVARACEPSSQTPVQRIARGEQLIHIADLSAELVVAAVDDAGIRTFLSVPLRRGDALLGVFSVYRREVRPFSNKQIGLVQNFAAQAVIAIENARLITETREALEQQTATAEVLQVINSSPGDLAPVFDAILEKAHTLCGAAHGNLWTYDGELFHPVATRGNPRFAEWLRDRSSVPAAPGTVLERIVRGEDFLQIADAASDQAFCTSAYSREVIEVTGARTTLIISLRKDTALLV
jgi:GAF domain